MSLPLSQRCARRWAPVDPNVPDVAEAVETNADQCGESNKPDDFARPDVGNPDGADRLARESAGRRRDAGCAGTLDLLGAVALGDSFRPGRVGPPAKIPGPPEPAEAVLEAWWESDRSLARLGLGCPPAGPISTTSANFVKRSFGLRWIGSESSQADRLGLEQLVSDVESLALLEREVTLWRASGRRRGGVCGVGPPQDGSAFAAISPPWPSGPGLVLAR